MSLNFLEQTLESPLDNKEIKPVNPNGNQHWIFIGKADAEAKAPILWPPDVKSRPFGKDYDAGKDWGQEEEGTTRKRWLNGIIDSKDMILSKLQEIVKDRKAWSAAPHGVAKSQTWLSDWTTTIFIYLGIYYKFLFTGCHLIPFPKIHMLTLLWYSENLKSYIPGKSRNEICNGFFLKTIHS